jgi:uncharacterized integral membrane protein
MWIIRWVVMLLVMLLVIGFAMLNSEQKVSISFYWWQTIDLPIWVVMYVAFAVGMVVWLFVSIFQVLALKNRMRKLKKENHQLKEELDRMRNVAIEEVVVPDDQASETNLKSFEE